MKELLLGAMLTMSAQLSCYADSVPGSTQKDSVLPLLPSNVRPGMTISEFRAAFPKAEAVDGGSKHLVFYVAGLGRTGELLPQIHAGFYADALVDLTLLEVFAPIKDRTRGGFIEARTRLEKDSIGSLGTPDEKTTDTTKTGKAVTRLVWKKSNTRSIVLSLMPAPEKIERAQVLGSLRVK